MSNAQAITGEYFLTGVHETAAGFLLNADSTFQFFYSEGALDRQAKGVWTTDGKKVVFNTAAAPTSDYKLILTSNLSFRQLYGSVTSYTVFAAVGLTVILRVVSFLFPHL